MRRLSWPIVRWLGMWLGLLLAACASVQPSSTPPSSPTVAASPTFDTINPASQPAVPAVRYWQLPSGSKIAYVHFAPARAGSVFPLIFVHGGPGAYQVADVEHRAALFQQLAQLGFHVYLYDQIGSGLSARLDDPRQYTVARHVADLELIRQTIGAEQLILIGESWGATLSANYMAQYPDHAHQAVFISPGPIDFTEWAAARPATPRVRDDMLDWVGQTYGDGTKQRYRQLDALLQRDLPAAHAFASDRELDPVYDRFIAEQLLPICTVNPDRAQSLTAHGMGWWANLMTLWDAQQRDVHPRAVLAQNTTPVLVLRGDADYVSEEMAEQYVATLPNAVLLRVRKAGHLIWLDRPEIYDQAVIAFLLGQPLPQP